MKRLLLLVLLPLLSCCDNDTVENVEARFVHYETVLGGNESNRSFTFSMRNASEIIVSFEGEPCSFTIEGGNDNVNWQPLQVYTLYTANGSSSAISLPFTAQTGNSCRLGAADVNFCRIRFLSTADKLSHVSITIYTEEQPVKVLKFNGDNMALGTGAVSGQNISGWVSAEFQDYLVVNDAIGGQNSTQVFSRQGGLPVSLSVQDNALMPGSYKDLTELSTAFISTPASGATMVIAGAINNRPVIVRQQEGQYSVITPLGQEDNNFAVAPQSVFIPANASNYKNAINIFWAGMNDSDYSQTLSNYAQAINLLEEPKRFLVVGLPPLLNLGIGTADYENKIAFNAALKAAYPGHYVEALPPTQQEMDAIGYQPTDQDWDYIENGVFPIGMRADNTHFNGTGYRIMANRIIALLHANGY